MARCKVCGKQEPVMQCICAECAKEATPQRHWEWASDGDGYVCPVCGTDYCIMVGNAGEYKYCPMRGEPLLPPIGEAPEEKETMPEVKPVDANKIIRDLTAMKGLYDAITLDGMIKALEEAQEAVVRCKDCVNRNTLNCAMYTSCDGCNAQWSWETDNDFCSWGERRENNG